MNSCLALIAGLLAPLVSPHEGVRSHAQDSLEARLRAAHGRSAGQVLRLVGSTGNEHERAPVTLLFTGDGRFVADHGEGLLRDKGFDGERPWGRDHSGRPYELFGVEHDTELLLNGVLSGNWCGSLAPWRIEELPGAPEGEVHVVLRLEGRPFEARLELDAASLRVRGARYLKQDGLIVVAIEEWGESELGASPRRVKYSASGLELDFRFDPLEAAGDVGPKAFSPKYQARADFAFDPEAPAELTARVGRTGHTFVRALVDGRDLGWFAFDTGASHSVVSNEVADELAMDTIVELMSGSGAGGDFSLRLCRGRALTVGPITWRGPLFGVTDLSLLERSFGVELAGVLGAEVLVQGQWEHDRGAARLAVFPPSAELERNGTLWLDAVLDAGHILVDASFEGHEGMFIVDSGGGAMGVNFYSDAVQRLGLLEGRRTRGVAVGGFGGSSSQRSGKIATFTLGDRTWKNLAANFDPDANARRSDPYVTGLIGFRLLDPHVVIYDYPRRRLGLFER